MEQGEEEALPARAQSGQQAAGGDPQVTLAIMSVSNVTSAQERGAGLRVSG